MGDLSRHFNRIEFACKCGCGRDTMDYETLQVLEGVRQHFGAPVFVHSGYRCPNHNKAVGGASSSQHLYGRAVDFEVDGVLPDSVAQHLETTYPQKYGIGRYDSFTHLDTRSGPRSRWDYSK